MVAEDATSLTKASVEANMPAEPASGSVLIQKAEPELAQLLAREPELARLLEKEPRLAQFLLSVEAGARHDEIASGQSSSLITKIVS